MDVDAHRQRLWPRAVLSQLAQRGVVNSSPHASYYSFALSIAAVPRRAAASPASLLLLLARCPKQRVDEHVDAADEE